MIRLRRGTVIEARPTRRDLVDLVVEIDGARERAVAYPSLTGDVRAGQTVICNTTAVALGLGTGGVHFVVAVEGAESDLSKPSGHAMKLRYTPVQTSVDAVEETHREAIDAVESLEGLPVVVAGLHSALAPAAIAAHAVAPDARLTYVMTDTGALHAAFSRTLAGLRDAGLIDATITTGQATGGDYEAVTIYGALAAAKAVARADIVIVAMGPGNLGTGSRWGFALLETAGIADAVAAMGGRPIIAPRMSFADPRERHRGVSHHTLTALSVTHAVVDVALPHPLVAERYEIVHSQLAESHHRILDVPLGPAEEALSSSPVPLRSMGRGFADDPDYFRSPAAAAVLAVEAPR
ncbi:MAG: DUF3866 family protein [Actinomycetota bacterium]